MAFPKIRGRVAPVRHRLGAVLEPYRPTPPKSPTPGKHKKGPAAPPAPPSAPKLPRRHETAHPAIPTAPKRSQGDDRYAHRRQMRTDLAHTYPKGHAIHPDEYARREADLERARQARYKTGEDIERGRRRREFDAIAERERRRQADRDDAAGRHARRTVAADTGHQPRHAKSGARTATKPAQSDYPARLPRGGIARGETARLEQRQAERRHGRAGTQDPTPGAQHPFFRGGLGKRDVKPQGGNWRGAGR